MDIVTSFNEIKRDDTNVIMLNMKRLFPANSNPNAIVTIQNTQIIKLITKSCCIRLTRSILFFNNLHWSTVEMSHIPSLSQRLTNSLINVTIKWYRFVYANNSKAIAGKSKAGVSKVRFIDLLTPYEIKLTLLSNKSAKVKKSLRENRNKFVTY